MQLSLKALILILLIPFSLYCQKDEILCTIGKKKISKTEFIESFIKNNTAEISDNQDSARNYLEQFIEFKLKVIEAENQGLDKKQSFKDEFENYRKLLALPLLLDQEIIRKLEIEAYERMKTEVRARHILIRVDKDASAKDTILAFQKAVKILKRLTSGENFEKIAQQVSDDHQAALTGGDLWYVGPFEVPYELENYLYSQNITKFSNPVRTVSGYHIVEILDKRTNPGRYKVAHILISVTDTSNKELNDKGKLLIDSIYQLLYNGQDFGELALRYSNDKGTSASGGELPWFESGRMPHEFELSCYNLRFDGAISKPLKTRFGWHIIKRISQNDIPEYQQIEDQILQKIINSDRLELAIAKTINKLKNAYQFSDSYTVSALYQMVDSTIFKAEWKIPEGQDLSTPMFSFDNQTITQNDFLHFLENRQSKMYPVPIENYIISQYSKFIEETLLKHEQDEFERKSKKYSLLLDECRDRILYSDIMQKEVWDKAANDYAGLLSYYNKNKHLYNNIYEADISVFEFSLDDPSRIEKVFKKLKASDIDDNEIVLRISSNLDKRFKLIQKSREIAGNNPLFDKCIDLHESGQVNINERLIIFADSKKLIWFNTELKKSEKPFEEIKGLVLEDYQRYIENLWVSDLKKKYKVELNENVFKSLF